MSDNNKQHIGVTEVPPHYAGERETIDKIRDELGDRGFVAFCRGQHIKYAERAGRKTLGDPAKAKFYFDMALHVRNPDEWPDPRTYRAGHEEYVREKTPQNPEIAVLDHGYVRLVESWGVGDVGVREAGIIEAARQSTAGSFRGWDKDAKLLKYLYENKHAGPFEFAGMTIEVQAPLFVFRQWHRHRTQSYNETSARYVEMPELDYVPSVERVLAKRGRNKQAGGLAGVDPIDREAAAREVFSLQQATARSRALYRNALQSGMPKELARLYLHVNAYSRMRASANLRNWLAFLTLRCDEHAQWEIRQFADAVSLIISEEFPRTHELWWAEVSK